MYNLLGLVAVGAGAFFFMRKKAAATVAGHTGTPTGTPTGAVADKPTNTPTNTFTGAPTPQMTAEQRARLDAFLLRQVAEKEAATKAAADRAAQGLTPLTQAEKTAQMLAALRAAQLAKLAAVNKITAAAVKPLDTDVIGSVIYSSPTGAIIARTEPLTKATILAASATIRVMAPTAKYPWTSGYLLPFSSAPSVHESNHGHPAFAPRPGVRWNGGETIGNAINASTQATICERNAIKYVDADSTTTPDRLQLSALYAGALFQLRDYLLENQL